MDAYDVFDSFIDQFAPPEKPLELYANIMLSPQPETENYDPGNTAEQPETVSDSVDGPKDTV